MKEIVIVSGKGGTGKTSLTAAFSCLSSNSIYCDADVDAADLHLLLKPEILEEHEFHGGGIAVVRQEACTECGVCRELCKFEAVRPDLSIDPLGCEGCGVCVDLCPAQAIDFPERKSGDWYVSDTRNGVMVHAKLGIAQENSGRLVSLIRQEAKKRAEERGVETIITDGPPGIGCPVIAAITGASILLVVVEPTVSGRHDMERVVRLADHFKIPSLVCVNKYDLNEEMTVEIIERAEQMGMGLAGKIPFDVGFTHAMVKAKSFLEEDGASITAEAIRKVWERVEFAAAREDQAANRIIKLT